MRTEKQRIVPGADTAILFVHGILGTPAHFEAFYPLVPSDWSFRGIWLRGHGGSVKDFASSSMSEWKAQVHSATLDLLKTHKKVIIAAHSMGTLFAIREATELPITALFLLNVPLKAHIGRRLPKTMWAVFRGKIDPNDEWLLAAQKAYGIGRDMNILHYLGWIPRYLELFSEIRKTRKIIEKIKIPCRAYFSTEDEMVSPKSAEILAKNSSAHIKILDSSGHFYYSPKDLETLRSGFCEMIKETL